MPNYLIIDGVKYNQSSRSEAVVTLARVKDAMLEARDGEPSLLGWEGDADGVDIFMNVLITPSTTVHAVFDRADGDPASDGIAQQIREAEDEWHSKVRRAHDATNNGDSDS